MKNKTVTIQQLTCFICGHQWFPKMPEKPICCPKCRRADWENGRGPRSIKAAKRARQLQNAA